MNVLTGTNNMMIEWMVFALCYCAPRYFNSLL